VTTTQISGLPVRRTGFVDHDGESLYYEVIGEGQVPLVLCHGAGGNHASWFQQVAVFAPERQVVVWDHRGYGRSSDRRDRSGTEVAAGDLLAVCDHLGIARADLVGQSMGGWTVVGAALARPSLARSLVLTDTPAGFSLPSLPPRGGAVRRGLLAAGDRLGVHPAVDPAFSVTHTALAHLYQSLGRMGTADPDVVLPRVGKVTHDAEDAARLTMPVLCVVGERDPLVPPAAVHELAALLPHAHVVEIAGCGHSPYFEAASAWNDEVRAFLSELR
jgi:pimeloyl-ACP methyl ester carboxylesterase